MKPDILIENEAEANRQVAKVMLISFFIYTLIYVLNLLGIFVINHKVMTISYILSAFFLLLPSIINKFVSIDNPSLKYIYIIFSCLFILEITTLLTYHTVVVYCYPILLAGLYFSQKPTIIAIILTVIFTVLGQILGFYFNFRPDANFLNWYKLVYYSILPRLLCLTSLAALFRSLTMRTTELLQKQEDDDKELLELSQDMISGFATLVENRDENTGGHIKRTSMYVKLLAEKLANDSKYRDIISQDFIDNLIISAPMHDIGKIAIPDSILQKTGKLEPDEYEIMKTHAVKGGDIITQTFGHVKDDEYRKMAFEVARYHHEKWNGTGYPDHFVKYQIPLSARIMAIADVFDAVSQKRCYRDAMPIEQCFKIIEEGSNKDFDPDLVSAFMEIRPQIEKICMEFRDE